MTRVTSPAQLIYNYIEDSQSEVKKNYNEKFIEKYNYGERDKALSYLNRGDIDLDINYKEGSFLIQAVREDDAELVGKLLEKGATVGLVEALKWAAYNGYILCMEALIEHGVDPALLQGTSTSTNHPRTREFLANRKLAKPEASIHPVIERSNIHPTTGSPTTNDNSISLSEQSSELQTSYTVSSSTGKIHKSTHDLVVNGAEQSTSGSFINRIIEPIIYQKEKLEAVDKTVMAEIHTLSEKPDLNKEDRIRMMDLSRISVELMHLKTGNFILQKFYPAETGRLIKSFSIIPEAINGKAMNVGYSLPRDKLHYAEEKIFEVALSELGSELSGRDSEKAFASNVVVVEVFARHDGRLKANPITNLLELHSIVLWRKNKDEIVLIEPTTSKFGQHIVKFLNSRFDLLKFTATTLGARYPSEERRRAYSSAVKIAREIDGRLHGGGTSTSDMQAILNILEESTASRAIAQFKKAHSPSRHKWVSKPSASRVPFDEFLSPEHQRMRWPFLLEQKKSRTLAYYCSSFEKKGVEKSSPPERKAPQARKILPTVEKSKENNWEG